MKKTIIEGKNIDEVKAKAIEIFKEPIEKLNIEIKSEKRFLGIGAQVQALVYLKVIQLRKV